MKDTIKNLLYNPEYDDIRSKLIGGVAGGVLGGAAGYASSLFKEKEYDDDEEEDTGIVDALTGAALGTGAGLFVGSAFDLQPRFFIDEKSHLDYIKTLPGYSTVDSAVTEDPTSGTARHWNTNWKWEDMGGIKTEDSDKVKELLSNDLGRVTPGGKAIYDILLDESGKVGPESMELPDDYYKLVLTSEFLKRTHPQSYNTVDAAEQKLAAINKLREQLTAEGKPGFIPVSDRVLLQQYNPQIGPYAMAVPAVFNNVFRSPDSFRDINSIMGIMQTKDKKTRDTLGYALKGMSSWDRESNGFAGLTDEHINNGLLGPMGNAASLHELGHITSAPNNQFVTEFNTNPVKGKLRYSYTPSSFWGLKADGPPKDDYLSLYSGRSLADLLSGTYTQKIGEYTRTIPTIKYFGQAMGLDMDSPETLRQNYVKALQAIIDGKFENTPENTEFERLRQWAGKFGDNIYYTNSTPEERSGMSNIKLNSEDLANLWLQMMSDEALQTIL